MRDFRDKVVVITGAASGIGRAFAHAFARRGARLALNDYREEALEKVKLELSANMLTTAAFDVADRQAMYNFADSVKALQPASVIINNAGIGGCGLPVSEMPDSALERVMNINFWGVVHGTRAFLPQLKQQPEGAILNVSSIFGLLGMPYNGDYSAAKFAVRGFTEVLMSELHESQISVHSLHPGGIKTDIEKTRYAELEVPDDGVGEEFNKKFLRTDPADVAEASIRAIAKGTPRIVTGYDSFRVSAAARFIPMKWLKGFTWKELKTIRDKALKKKSN